MLWIELSRELVSEGTISQTALAAGDPACHQLYEEGRLTSWTNAEPNAILSAVTGGATSRTIAERSLTTK